MGEGRSMTGPAERFWPAFVAAHSPYYTAWHTSRFGHGGGVPGAKEYPRPSAGLRAAQQDRKVLTSGNSSTGRGIGSRRRRSSAPPHSAFFMNSRGRCPANCGAILPVGATACERGRHHPCSGLAKTRRPRARCAAGILQRLLRPRSKGRCRGGRRTGRHGKCPRR